VGELRWLDWVLGGSVALLAVCLAAVTRKVDRVARAGRGATGGGSAEYEQVLARLRADTDRTLGDLAQVQEALARCVQRVGLVRYDAFEGSGGRLSFSLALLDGHGDGVVLSVLAGRDGSYAYAKALRDGVPSHPLSEEEKQAISAAMA